MRLPCSAGGRWEINGEEGYKKAAWLGLVLAWRPWSRARPRPKNYAKANPEPAGKSKYPACMQSGYSSPACIIPRPRPLLCMQKAEILRGSACRKRNLCMHASMQTLVFIFINGPAIPIHTFVYKREWEGAGKTTRILQPWSKKQKDIKMIYLSFNSFPCLVLLKSFDVYPYLTSCP
jgi:hypothetical protein